MKKKTDLTVYVFAAWNEITGDHVVSGVTKSSVNEERRFCRSRGCVVGPIETVTVKRAERKGRKA